ncbi:MAG: DUF6291 domain-containing protein [Prevotellaceae bacterium]|nr:DUF6291 domain-containing protein [Prevotellaceae bacterium]
MGKKKTFIFNTEWNDILGDFEQEVRQEVYAAVFEYAATGKVIEMRPLARMAFAFIKRELDYNAERYEEVSRKRSEAGRKGGGNPNFKKGQTNPYYQRGDKHEINKDKHEINKDKHEINKDKLYEYEYEDEYEDDINKRTINGSLSHSAESDAPTAPAKREDFNSKKWVEYWNRTMEENKATMPRVACINGKRLAGFRARISEHGEEAVRRAIDNAAKSDFLNGRRNSWSGNIDWIMQHPNNFVKVLEGNYDNDKNNTSNTNNQARNDNGNNNASLYDRRRGVEPPHLTEEDFENDSFI